MEKTPENKHEEIKVTKEKENDENNIHWKDRKNIQLAPRLPKFLKLRFQAPFKFRRHSQKFKNPNQNQKSRFSKLPGATSKIKNLI